VRAKARSPKEKYILSVKIHPYPVNFSPNGVRTLVRSIFNPFLDSPQLTDKIIAGKGGLKPAVQKYPSL
jgi:hypothetical protein